MGGVKLKKLRWIWLSLSLVLIVFFLSSLMFSFPKGKNSDEYFFYGVSKGIPEYVGDMDYVKDADFAPPPWYTVEEWKQAWINAYDTPIWAHPPMAAILFKPFTYFDIKDLKVVPIIIAIINFGILAYIIRRRTKSDLIAVFSFLPVFLSWRILEGFTWLYNDMFMWLFFMVSCLILELKPNSKWIYLTAGIMVLTKLPAFLLLAPLALLRYEKLKSIRQSGYVIACGAFLIPYLLWTVAVTGNWLYLPQHWAIISSTIVRDHWSNYVSINLWYFIREWGLIFLAVFTIPGFIYSCFKKQFAYPSFFLITLLLGFGWGFIIYSTAGVLYGAIPMAAITMYPIYKRFLAPKQPITEGVKA